MFLDTTVTALVCTFDDCNHVGSKFSRGYKQRNHAKSLTALTRKLHPMLHPHTELYGLQYRQPNKHETTPHAHQRVD